MISADLPDNEQDRLEALYKYEILDTEAEKVFDDLTQLASEICDTPIALISLIDPDRQWFKSTTGLDAKETARDIAFCAHAIHQKEIFEVSDTHKDERFKDNPLVTSDPNIRFYAGAPLITPDGLAVGTLCAIGDKAKTLNQHQRNALEILSREVIAQLELRIKIREIEKASQLKTDFLSNLSHELRTPLNAIISFSQLMLHDEKHTLPEHYYTYLKHLDYSGKRLLDLVNSVLDLNKIESGKLELQVTMVNVREFFDSMHGLINSIASNKSVKIEFTVSAKEIRYFQADEARLSQIILNISSNAIKFSNPKQTVNIHVFITSKTLTIAVKDQGIGIAKEDIPLLFSKFQQVGNASNEEGSGLGLMITKNLVELMGGNIKLSSDLAKGTLVKIVIPLQKVSIQAIDKTQTELPIRFNKNASILVVEDNQINQQVAKAIFESLGIKIEIAASGEIAVQMLGNNKFDMIFMDLHLPGIDGYETSRQIIAINPDQNIVALTADVFTQQDQRLQLAGMNKVLNKPIEIAQLIDALNLYCPAC